MASSRDGDRAGTEEHADGTGYAFTVTQNISPSAPAPRCRVMLLLSESLRVALVTTTWRWQMCPRHHTTRLRATLRIVHTDLQRTSR